VSPVTDETKSTPHSHSQHAEVATSLRNAIKLGGSLVMTLVIGFGVRVALRRYLGPTVIGPVNFADAFSAVGFVFVGLGVDTHIRKVVPVRLESASEFLGAVLVIRLLVSGVVFIVMAAVLHLMGQPPEVRDLVWAYGAAQAAMSVNQTFVALLQSARTVDGLSVTNVLSKLVWAVGFVATMAFGWPLVGVPLSVFASEVLRAIVGWYLVKKHLKLEFRVDWAQVRPTLRASFAFYLNAVALVVVNRFDVNVLKVRADDTEIGLYSAAAEMAQLTFVMTPMLPGVVMPLFARTLASGPEAYYRLVRRTLELVLVLSFPISLGIAVGSDVWVRLVYGAQYMNASWALSILGPSFLLTYISVISAIALNMSGGEWTVTVTSLLSMVVNPLLVISLVSLAKRWGWPEGGAGAACAMASITTESLVLVAMFYRLGVSVWDARLVKVLLKSLAVSLAVFAVDRAFLTTLGPARVVVDAVLYVVLVMASGAVALKETVAFAKTLRRGRGAPEPQVG